LKVINGRGSGTLTSPGCSPSQFFLTVSAAGNVSGEGHLNCIVGNGVTGPLTIDGNFQRLTFRGERAAFIMPPLRPGAAPAQPATSAATTAYDGVYSGTVSTTSLSRANLTLQLTNGRGSITLTSPGCSPSQFSVTVSPIGAVTGVRSGAPLNAMPGICYLRWTWTIQPSLQNDHRGQRQSRRW